MSLTLQGHSVTPTDIAHMLVGERAPECGPVARIIQMIGDFGVIVLARHFVNLPDRFLRRL